MKSPYALSIAAALTVAALAGCGQTGPLYMPKPPAKPAAAPAKPVTPIVAPTTDAAPAQTLTPTPAPVQ
ncbi:LPS translocon maturation chaperone LptM [Massilia litorea]|uniref:Lipoprotein n=1 Tax=Massilia litorea TaxID=2769491 RepID=A0A7L9U7J5_9BURK|nr:lipoprotein [Massilia litorea]QOL50429.1 lipoprotein [Massilia litorea]